MIYNGYSIKATYNGITQPTYWATTALLNYNTINGYVKINVPVITPYGYISVPEDNTGCAYAGIGNFQAAAIIGYNNIQPSDSNVPSTLTKGEICLVSKGNYAFSIQNNKLYITFTNGNHTVINTRVTIDENVNTILIDTIAEITALEDKVNDLISKYNNHTHTPGSYTAPSGGGPITGISGTGTPSETIYTATSNFTRDQNFINQSPSQMFINNDGTIIT